MLQDPLLLHLSVESRNKGLFGYTKSTLAQKGDINDDIIIGMILGKITGVQFIRYLALKKGGYETHPKGKPLTDFVRHIYNTDGPERWCLLELRNEKAGVKKVALVIGTFKTPILSLCRLEMFVQHKYLFA